MGPGATAAVGRVVQLCFFRVGGDRGGAAVACTVLPAFVLQLLVAHLAFGARDVTPATLTAVFAGSWLAYALVMFSGAADDLQVLGVFNLALLCFGVAGVTRPKRALWLVPAVLPAPLGGHRTRPHHRGRMAVPYGGRPRPRRGPRGHVHGLRPDAGGHAQQGGSAHRAQRSRAPRRGRRSVRPAPQPGTPGGRAPHALIAPMPRPWSGLGIHVRAGTVAFSASAGSRAR